MKRLGVPDRVGDPCDVKAMTTGQFCARIQLDRPTAESVRPEFVQLYHCTHSHSFRIASGRRKVKHALEMLLHVGTITALAGDRSIFTFAEDCVADSNRNTLSLLFKERCASSSLKFRRSKAGPVST